MRVLAVDTTSRAASLAVLEDEVAVGLLGLADDRDHAETLLPSIDELLDRLSLSLEAIDLYAVARGPGSFTGLRIGIATVEGLAFARGRPAVGVSLLDAAAERYRLRAGLLAPFFDARRGEVFAALYRADGRGALAEIVPAAATPPEPFLASLPREPVLLVGTGVRTYAAAVEAAGAHVVAAPSSFFFAEEIGRLALRRYREHGPAAAGPVEALYLRPSDAERARASVGEAGR